MQADQIGNKGEVSVWREYDATRDGIARYDDYLFKIRSWWIAVNAALIVAYLGLSPKAVGTNGSGDGTTGGLSPEIAFLAVVMIGVSFWILDALNKSLQYVLINLSRDLERVILYNRPYLGPSASHRYQRKNDRHIEYILTRMTDESVYPFYIFPIICSFAIIFTKFYYKYGNGFPADFYIPFLISGFIWIFAKYAGNLKIISQNTAIIIPVFYVFHLIYEIYIIDPNSIMGAIYAFKIHIADDIKNSGILMIALFFIFLIWSTSIYLRDPESRASWVLASDKFRKSRWREFVGECLKDLYPELMEPENFENDVERKVFLAGYKVEFLYNNCAIFIDYRRSRKKSAYRELRKKVFSMMNYSAVTVCIDAKDIDRDWEPYDKNAEVIGNHLNRKIGEFVSYLPVGRVLMANGKRNWWRMINPKWPDIPKAPLPEPASGRLPPHWLRRAWAWAWFRR